MSGQFRSETFTCYHYGGIGLDHHLNLAFADGWEPILVHDVAEPTGCARCGISSTYEVAVTFRRRRDLSPVAISPTPVQ